MVRSGEPKKEVVIGRRPVLELLRSGATVDSILLATGSKPAQVLRDIESAAADANVGIRRVERSEIEVLAEGANHQGVAALTGRYRYRPLHEILEGGAQALLFLDGVMDPHNLGSLLRSADGAGFDGVVIPAHRSSAVTQTVRRVSAGAAEVVPVARETNLGRALEAAQEAGFWLAGLDQDAEENLWSSTLLDPPVGLVVGSEDRGLSKGIRARCDGLVKIPTLGRLGSLNASVAGALGMFEVSRRRGGSATL